MNNEIIKAFIAHLKSPEVTAEQLYAYFNDIKKNNPEILTEERLEVGQNFFASDVPANNTADSYYKNLAKLENSNFSRERIEYLIRVREILRHKGTRGFIPVSRLLGSHQESEGKITMHYTPSTNLRRFVQEGDLLTIRTALRMELNDNSLTNADLEAAMEWTQEQVPNLNLFEPFVEKAFARGMESDRSLWNTQYYDNQMVYLKTNFSAERFRHLILVRSMLRQQGVKGFVALPPVPPRSNNGSHDTAQGYSDVQETVKRQDSSEGWRIPFRVILIFGCSLAVAVMVIMFVLMTHNNGPNQ